LLYLIYTRAGNDIGTNSIDVSNRKKLNGKRILKRMKNAVTEVEKIKQSKTYGSYKDLPRYTVWATKNILLISETFAIQ